MKVTITKLEVQVDGEAHEIRAAVPAILATSAVQETPAELEMSRAEGGRALGPAVEAGVGAGSNGNAGSHSEPPRPPAQDDEPLLHERVAAMDDWKPAPADPRQVPTRRLDRWEDVPVAHRVWNSTKSVCHVSRAANEPTDTFCGADVGMFRDPNLTPLGGATVCGNCNRRIEEANR